MTRPDGRYQRYDLCPRCDPQPRHAASILYRLEGEPAVKSAGTYSDVAARRLLCQGGCPGATENKIVSGYGNGFFGPADNITREQMAAMLYRYASYKGYDVSRSGDLKFYTDAASIGSWAVDALRWANAEGLINGRTSSTLVPAGTATRAEAATILTRFCQRYVPELTTPEERNGPVNTNGSIGVDSRTNTLRPRAVPDSSGSAMVRISGTQLKKLIEMTENLDTARALIIPTGPGEPEVTHPGAAQAGTEPDGVPVRGGAGAPDAPRRADPEYGGITDAVQPHAQRFRGAHTGRRRCRRCADGRWAVCSRRA